MDRSSLHNTHAKLLAFDLNTRDGALVSRAEVVGVVTLVDLIPDKLLRFFVDDGTGIAICVLWLNHLSSPFFARRPHSDLAALAALARARAAQVAIGKVVRVRGRLGRFRGENQVTVEDLVVERDPNVEVMHWLECMRLARDCYDAVEPCRR